MKCHALVRKEVDVSLKPFEQGLLAALYKPGSTRINMNEVGTRLGMKSKLIDEPLEQEKLAQRGWWIRNERKTDLADSVRNIDANSFRDCFYIQHGRWKDQPFRNSRLATLGRAPGRRKRSLVYPVHPRVIVYGATFSVLTPSGENQSVLWKGFGEYLKQVSKGKEPTSSQEYFEKYLAYAAVFGLGKEWAKHFQELGGVPLPAWLHAMDGLDGDFGAMVAIMSASDTAGASADGGGGGASGGGSSGAG